MSSEGPGTLVPRLLHHYYDRAVGPFVNLSDLPLDQACAVQKRIVAEGALFASRRSPDYVEVRFGLEDRLREAFVARGGRPQRERPHYLTLGACDWLREWYPDPAVVTVDLDRVPADQVSFTYGDLFPAFRWEGDDRPGRAPGSANPTRGRVFLRGDLPGLIARYGLPQRVNPTGEQGPLRYIEAHLWADGPIERLR